MDTFVVNIHLRIITVSDSDDGKILVFLDDNGDIPKIQLSSSSSIDYQIEDRLRNLFYENDLYTILSTKQISSISNGDQNLDIFYNFLSTSTASKTGSFVYFNKYSIELHRLANNHGI